MDAPHYVRFARTLALATTIALPACSGAADPTAADGEGHAAGAAAPTSSAGAAPGGSTPVEVTAAVTTASPPEDVDAGSDASQGHVSGPLPPPEMPASLVGRA